jgi:hypothetical protein
MSDAGILDGALGNVRNIFMGMGLTYGDAPGTEKTEVAESGADGRP